jgi:hypothetical protein
VTVLTRMAVLTRMTVLSRMVAVADRLIARAAARRRRLIGLAITRIAIGTTTVLYCLADYSRRELLWGPRGYVSPRVAAAGIPPGGFSIFLVSNAEWWFEVAFAVFGGRALAIAQAVTLWSLHYRNQDVLDGGDNLAQILVIFLALTVTNAYFAPGARRRRQRMSAGDGQASVAVLVHNLGAYLVVFQTCALYLAAGYWKMFGTVWQDGVAMYYISRLRQFDMFPAFSAAMGNPYLGTATCWLTLIIEVGFTFCVLSARPWLREVNIALVEGMHAGIMAFMGLVTFGLIMIGADSACLRDDDYRALHRYARSLWNHARATARPAAEPELQAAGA